MRFVIWNLLCIPTLKYWAKFDFWNSIFRRRREAINGVLRKFFLSFDPILFEFVLMSEFMDFLFGSWRSFWNNKSCENAILVQVDMFGLRFENFWVFDSFLFWSRFVNPISQIFSSNRIDFDRCFNCCKRRQKSAFPFWSESSVLVGVGLA